MVQHVRISVRAVGTSDYNSYPVQYDETQQLLAQLEAQSDALFYRTEMTSWYSLNDPALYGYSGISQFSSMANRNITTFLRTLGLPASEAGNRYYYALTSPLTNMFTGIRYVLSRSGSVMDTATLTEVGSVGTMTAYENQYTLPIGFLAQQDLLTYDGTEYANAFEAQNALFAKATGLATPLFTAIDVTQTEHTGMAEEPYGVYQSSYGMYTFREDETATEHRFQFDFVPQETSVLYAYFWADGVDRVSVLQEETEIGSYNVTRQQGFIAPIGTCAAGVTTSVCASVTDETIRHGSLRLYVYALNQEILEEGYEKLLAGGIALTEFSDTGLTGTISATEDGICYFSIPAESGWTAYVDGVKTETEIVGNAMLAVPLTEGTHTITLRYCPKGLVAGMVLTGFSAAIWIAMLLRQRYLKQNRFFQRE
jgi:uncharacterized membrane protein YfhO